MPRTIEGIVECHTIARDRISRGLPSWNGTLLFLIALQKLAERHDEGDITLTAQELLDGFKSAAKEIREKIPQAQERFFASKDDDLEYFVLTLEEMTVSTVENSSAIFDDFDIALDRLYDWCDVNRWFLRQF